MTEKMQNTAEACRQKSILLFQYSIFCEHQFGCFYLPGFKVMGLGYHQFGSGPRIITQGNKKKKEEAMDDEFGR